MQSETNTHTHTLNLLRCCSRVKTLTGTGRSHAHAQQEGPKSEVRERQPVRFVSEIRQLIRTGSRGQMQMLYKL